MPCCHERRLPSGPLAAGTQTAADAGRQSTNTKQRWVSLEAYPGNQKTTALRASSAAQRMPSRHPQRMASGTLPTHPQVAADAGNQVPNNAVWQLQPLLATKRQQRCVLAQMRTASPTRTCATSALSTHVLGESRQRRIVGSIGTHQRRHNQQAACVGGSLRHCCLISVQSVTTFASHQQCAPT